MGVLLNSASSEIDILDPQRNALHQSHASTIEQLCHQRMKPFHFRQDGRHFPLGQHSRKSRGDWGDKYRQARESLSQALVYIKITMHSACLCVETLTLRSLVR